MNLLVGIQRGVWVEGPGVGADTRCWNGTVVSVVVASKTEALWGDLLMNCHAPEGGGAQGEMSICGLTHTE